MGGERGGGVGRVAGQTDRQTHARTGSAQAHKYTGYVVGMTG